MSSRVATIGCARVVVCPTVERPERLLVEFQGRIETVGAQAVGEGSQSEHQSPIGTLHFEADGTTPVLLIGGGKQRLVGRRQKLSNPVAVLTRPFGVYPEGEANDLEVTHVIWEKIVFDSRPETVFSSR